MAAAVPEAPFVPVLSARYVEHRSRLSVGFRLILALPHIILLYLGLIASIVVSVFGWFAALILGRLPLPIERFLTRYVAYFTRVTAYGWLMTDRYPPFELEPSDWDVDVTLSPGRLNRLAVLFRLVLLIPAYVVWIVASTGLSLSLLVVWMIELFTARMPRPLFDAMVAVLRFGTRFGAYGLMVSASYPSGLLGDTPGTTPPVIPVGTSPVSSPTQIPEGSPPPPPLPSTAIDAPVDTERADGRLVLTTTAKRIVVLFIVLGALAQIGQSVYYSVRDGELVITVGFGRPPSFSKPIRAREAFIDASNELAGRLNVFQQEIQACTTASDPLRCEQDAERKLLDGLARFERTVDDIKFPDGLEGRVDTLRSAGASLETALGAMISADSEDEYLQRGPAFTQAGQNFDAAVIGLGRALDRLVGAD